MPKPERPPREIRRFKKTCSNRDIVAGNRLSDLGAVVGDHGLPTFQQEIARAARFALVDDGEPVAHR